ncbi:MAG: DUF2750 domain-containing protein [Ferruginibacter sp.]
MHPQKAQNIFKLSAEERYGYLIRHIADTEEDWIIRNQKDLVTLGNKNEQSTIPIFPEKYFAQLLLYLRLQNVLKCMP